MNLKRSLMSLSIAMALSVFATGESQAGSRADIKDIVVQKALVTAVPPSLALAVAKIESDFQVRALSPTGARGVMQIMPAAAEGEFGVAADELWDAPTNVRLGINILDGLIKRYAGRWDLALSHYHSGRILGAGDEAKPVPAAQNYAASVLRWERVYAAQRQVWHALTTRIAEFQRTPTPRATITGTQPERAVGVKLRPDSDGLDDFNAPIEQRRRQRAPRLDDLTPIRPSSGS